jgi:uncharacterized YigZ family protein
LGNILKYLQNEFENCYEEKKSKFIAFFMPYDKFNDVMKRLKEEHPKARHFVYAYRYLNEFDQIVENCSDDGEPRGTSGKPSLAVLSGAQIINSAVIIVRYFGGVKLGTGGLVRAYSSSVNEVINVSELFEYKKLETAKLKCDYSELSKLEYLLKQENITIKSKDFLEEIIVNIELSEKELKDLLLKLPRNIILQ